MQTKSERFEMRLDQDILARVDSWVAEQPDRPSRAEAIRRLVDSGLWYSRDQEPQVHVSDGERLIIHMVCELYKHLKVKGELDPDFIRDALFGGHNWALHWQYPGLFPRHTDERRVVSETVNILDMWSFIESGLAALTKKICDTVLQNAGALSGQVKFKGFDGNNEAEHLGIAMMLIDKMERFQSFKGRELNSHAPTLHYQRPMLAVFEPMRHNVMGGELTATQLTELLKVKYTPRIRR